jgi:hypothetical protein
MAILSRFAVALSAAAVALAAPAAEPQLDARGPHNFVLGPDHPLMVARNLTARANTNYNQDYTTGGTVSFTPGTNQFSVNWDTQEDFVVGVGWNPGSSAYVCYSQLISLLTVFHIVQLPTVAPSQSVVDLDLSLSTDGRPIHWSSTTSWSATTVSALAARRKAPLRLTVLLTPSGRTSV